MSGVAKKLASVINQFIRPTTFPVAIRIAGEGEERPAKAKHPKDLGNPLALCQGISLARRYGWTMVFRKEDQGCPVSLIVLGYHNPEKMLTGSIVYPTYTETPEAGAVMEKSMAILPGGHVEELWIGPLDRVDFDPDLVLVYGNPAQIARMVQGANYKSGKGINSKSFARMACSAYIAKPILDGECSLVVPSGGERIFAIAQDDEMIFSIPANQFQDVAFGIEEVHKHGLSRFPTPFYGLLLEPKVPAKYWELLED